MFPLAIAIVLGNVGAGFGFRDVNWGLVVNKKIFHDGVIIYGDHIPLVPTHHQEGYYGHNRESNGRENGRCDGKVVLCRGYVLWG